MAGTASRPGNLPVEVTRLVGRRRELSTAKTLLSSARLLTLTGPGGVGKTRLALRLAAEVRRTFPDGAWLVELASLNDPRLVADTVADALGLRSQTPEPAARLSDHLRKKRLLLVMDNCEHLLDGCAVLMRTLLTTAPELRMLATSRQAVGIDGEQVLPVPGLSLPGDGGSAFSGDLTRYESLALLIDRANMVLPGFTITEENYEPAVRLCRLLDGIPLAIELAAVHLRSLGIGQLVDRLDDRFRLLIRGSRVAPPRHQTLRATIDWSFDLCSPAEQALWARCSVFPGWFDLEAAEAVCQGEGIAPEDVPGLVTRLVDKSVLNSEVCEGRMRYRLLDTIRHYGREKLSGRGELAEVSARHRDYYRRLAERAEADRFGPCYGGWPARLLKDHSNLRAAMEYCLRAPGQEQSALEIAASLEDYWICTGMHHEGRHWLSRALGSSPEPTRARAKALCVCGFLNFWIADTDRASSSLAESAALAERLGDEPIAARATAYSGATALQKGDRTGLAVLEDSLPRLRAAGDSFGLWLALIQIAVGACAFGERRALRYAEEALALCESCDARLFKEHTQIIAGLVNLRFGDRRRAEALVKEALRGKRASGGLPWGIAHGLAVMAFLAAVRGRYERAAVLLGAAETVWSSPDSPVVRHWFMGSMVDQWERRARDALGDRRFESAFAAGGRLTLEQAVSLALGERPSPSRSAPAPPDDAAELTSREREVAALVARGMSNKQIADALVISPRTAEGHVERILVKLGFTSRAQIAAWADRASLRPGPG